MSIVYDLLRIKEFRESQAETEVRRRRSRLAEIVHTLQQMRSEIEEFRAWSAERELALFTALRGRLVRPRDLEQLRSQVVEWHDHERNLEQRADETERLRRQAAEETERALALLRQAGRQKDKFTELVRIHSLDVRRELDRKEELETEEFRPADTRDNDWEQETDESRSLLH